MTDLVNPKVRGRPILARCLLLSATALVIAGCKTEDRPPAALAPVAQGAPLANAPAAQSLPPAPAIPVSAVSNPANAYAFPDRAYEMSGTFGEAPPDYVYDYEGVQPWVWVSDDGSQCVAEAVPGGERYYYYEAGAAAPFFVQDPDYGYGYEGGRLVAVYDHSGRALPVGDIQLRVSIAARYLVRAQALYDASRRDHHLAVAESNWMARRNLVADQRQVWQRQINADPDWRAFHAQNAPAADAHWQAERVQRLRWAAHVDETMRNQDFATRERQEAQRVAAQQPAPPSSSLPHVTTGGEHPPAGRGTGQQQSGQAAPQSPTRPMQDRTSPATPPRDNHARQETPPPQANHPQPMPQHQPLPQQPATQTLPRSDQRPRAQQSEHMTPPPARVPDVPRHQTPSTTQTPVSSTRPPVTESRHELAAPRVQPSAPAEHPAPIRAPEGAPSPAHQQGKDEPHPHPAPSKGKDDDDRHQHD